MKAAAALALILLGCRGEPPSAAEIAAARETRPALERIPLQIRSETGTHDLPVEVAPTPEEKDRGASFPESLASGAGMLSAEGGRDGTGGVRPRGSGGGRDP